MAAKLAFAPFSKPIRPAHLLKRYPKISSRLLRRIAIFCLVSSIFVAYRQFNFISNLAQPDVAPNTASPSSLHPTSDATRLAEKRAQHIEASVNLWRREYRDCPPEESPPDPSLYATGEERCVALGMPDAVNRTLNKGDPASFWQMNSRALCYSNRPVCLFGRSLQNLLSFEERGKGQCQVLSVQHKTLHQASSKGLNESCAAFRNRYVASMYGKQVFYDWDNWQRYIQTKHYDNPRHHAVGWHSDFAIIVPKYDWSYNICHYNRIWNYIMYVIRNLNLFVPDADQIRHIDVLFRSGYKYNFHWHNGLRNTTLSYLQRQTGKTIRVAKIRYDYLRDFQCIRRGILLGREARVDAFPFLNDTDVWRPEMQINDSHWPVVPADSLWLRNAVLNESGLGSIATSYENGRERYDYIRVPPRRIGVLDRSPRSKRRLTPSGRTWLENTLEELSAKHNIDVHHIRTSAAMTFKEQVTQLQSIGLAVGIHGANMVNTVFMPPGGAIFEIFPWRYVRYYYASGGNSGLRYSFHEPEGGFDRNCSFTSPHCFMKYRESVLYLTESDRVIVRQRLENAIMYITDLHRRFPDGKIPLRKQGNVYHFG